MITAISILLLPVANSETFAQADASQLSQSSSNTEQATFYLTIAGPIIGSSGVAGLFWGLIQYRDSKILKRQETLLSLVQTFNKSNEMKLAIGLLDGFYGFEIDVWQEYEKKYEDIFHYNYATWHEPKYYHKKNFKHILMEHKDLTIIDDQGEKLVRNSFD